MAANDFSIGDEPTMRPAPSLGAGRRFASGDTILGRYTVVRELGEGGMGVVYKCLDSVGGVEVAVKGLPPEVSRNEEEMEDIRANYQIVRNLRHPNIAGAATLEKDPASGDYYLVMDLAPGITLKRWARRHTDVGIEARLAILRQVAAALDYAHAEKVIHRDVKPENVMVDDEGHVKVLDFGLAAQIRSSQSRTSNAITSKGGTPGYKSPEQWLGRPQKAPADVYSFGVLAYWLLVGRLPFDGDDPVVLGHAVLTAPVEPVEGLPAHMNAALAKALAKEPGERFATCGVFIDALGGAQLVAPATGGSRSRATAPLLIAASLVLAVLGGWLLLGGRARAPRAPQTGTTVVPPVATPEPTPPPRPAVTEVDVAGVADEAAVQKERVGRIDDSDGFKRRKDELADKLARATANGKAKRWGEAAVQFTNYVNECHALIALDGERQRAVAMRTKAEEAKARAVESEAEKYVGTRWNVAVRLQTEAIDKFTRKDFAAANGLFASAAEQFAQYADEAVVERKREDAETIRREAHAQQEKVALVSDNDGFKASKESLQDIFARAEKLFSGKEKRWIEAEILFRNYVNGCKTLVDLDGERQAATVKRTEAQTAFRRAEDAGAKTYATTRWNEVVGLWKKADNQFKEKEFAAAAEGFASAAKQFAQCADDATAKQQPLLHIIAKIGDQVVAGAKITDGVRDSYTPINLKLTKGNYYGPYTVSYESGGRRYVGTCPAVKADWSGQKTVSVILQEQEYSKPKADLGPHYEYIVERGQSLSFIAAGFGTTVQKIISANPGLKANALKVGQKLIIPVE